MFKKVFSSIIALFFSISTVTTFALDRPLNINDVQCETHEEIRDSNANLSPAQIAKLKSLGISNQELDNITIGEVADFLKSNSNIVNLEPMREYIDSNVLQRDAEIAKNNLDSLFDSFGFDEEDRYNFMMRKEKFINFDELTMEDAISQLSNPVPIQPYDNNYCHIFDGKRALDLLIESSACHFAPSAFPLYMYDAEFDEEIYVGKNPKVGSKEYTLKVDLLEDHLNDTRAAYKVLYNDSGTINSLRYAQFPYGEEANNQGREFHQGIDFNKSSSAPVYAITDGVITCIEYGVSSSALPKDASSLMVYNAKYDVTVIYSHLNIDKSLKVGNTISQGKKIGTQGKNGTSAQHTHVQLQSEIVDSENQIYPQGENLASLKPYAYFWIWTN